MSLETGSKEMDLPDSNEAMSCTNREIVEGVEQNNTDLIRTIII